MSSDVWNVANKQSAEEYYNRISHTFMGKAYAVNILANICEKMTNTYNTIVDDQNDYLVEVDNLTDDLKNFNNDMQLKIETLKNEIRELKQKEENGTITDEEKEELSAKREELYGLIDSQEKNTEQKTNEIAAETTKRQEIFRSKEKTATNYGETTVEKGTPLSETKVKNTFFRKLFGTTGKTEKRAGEYAVEQGNNLLEKVKESSDISKEIDKRVKANKTK